MTVFRESQSFQFWPPYWKTEIVTDRERQTEMQIQIDRYKD